MGADRHNVVSAHEYIEAGNVDIEKALDYQASARKKQCYCMILILVLGIIVMAIFGVFTPSSAKGSRRLLAAGGDGGNADALLVGDASGVGADWGLWASGEWSLVEPRAREATVAGVGAVAVPRHLRYSS